MKEVETDSSESSQDESLSAVNLVHSFQVPPPSQPTNLHQAQMPVTKAFLAKCLTGRTPTRTALRNLKSAGCGSSATSPVNNIPAKIIPEISSPDFIQVDQHKEVGQEPVIPVPRQEEKAPPTPACSFNCTEIVAMLGNDYLDPDEVASRAYPALVTVSGYRVKEEVASLARSIIAKYGDIGKDCICKTVEMRSSQIEKVCSIFRDLEAMETLLLTPAEIKSWLAVVDDLETMKINVKWLRDRLGEISETFELGKAYSALKDAQADLRTTLCTKKKEVVGLEEEQVRIGEAISSTRAKLKLYYRKSFVDGLL
jgi:hypothetical protein